MYDCLVCEVVVRLLQRIGWLQGKICRGWTLDFGKSKFWTAHYEIGVTDENSRRREKNTTKNRKSSSTSAWTSKLSNPLFSHPQHLLHLITSSHLLKSLNPLNLFNYVFRPKRYKIQKKSTVRSSETNESAIINLNLSPYDRTQQQQHPHRVTISFN